MIGTCGSPRHMWSPGPSVSFPAFRRGVGLRADVGRHRSCERAPVAGQWKPGSRDAGWGRCFRSAPAASPGQRKPGSGGRTTIIPATVPAGRLARLGPARLGSARPSSCGLRRASEVARPPSCPHPASIALVSPSCLRPGRGSGTFADKPQPGQGRPTCLQQGRGSSVRQGSFTLTDSRAGVDAHCRSWRRGIPRMRASWERLCPARKWEGKTDVDRCGRDTSAPRTCRSQDIHPPL